MYPLFPIVMRRRRQGFREFGECADCKRITENPIYIGPNPYCEEDAQRKRDALDAPYLHQEKRQAQEEIRMFD